MNVPRANSSEEMRKRNRWSNLVRRKAGVAAKAGAATTICFESGMVTRRASVRFEDD